MRPQQLRSVRIVCPRFIVFKFNFEPMIWIYAPFLYALNTGIGDILAL